MGRDEELCKSLIFATKPSKETALSLRGRPLHLQGDTLCCEQRTELCLCTILILTATRATQLLSDATFEALHSFDPVNESLLVTEPWFPEKV